MRSGTENIPGIVGFAKAVEVAKKTNWKKIEKLRDNLIKRILLTIKDTKLNGPKVTKLSTLGVSSPREPTKNRLQNNLNISFTNVEGEAVGGYLENKGIFVSTGSACMSNTLESSHVLKALNISDLDQNSSIRFSLSKYTTAKEIDYVLKTLPDIINKLRKLSPLLK